MTNSLKLLQSTRGITHHSLVRIERMSDLECHQSIIHFDYAPSDFGRLLLASTQKGVCYIAFADSPDEGITDLKHRFPCAQFVPGSDEFQQRALALFDLSTIPSEPLCLHLRGTNFQLKVWSALLNIPVGALTGYGDIAQSIENPKASRAVGTAIGNNPVSFLIPCHRVVRSSGALGGYRWGLKRKESILQWEKEITSCATNVNKSLK